MTFPNSFARGGTGSPSLPLVQTDAQNFQVTADHNGKWVQFTGSASTTFLLPSASSVATGFNTTFSNTGGGFLTLTPKSGDTFITTDTSWFIRKGQTYRLSVQSPSTWCVEQLGSTGTGLGAVQLGLASSALVNLSTAVGRSATASGVNSAAYGYASTASGTASSAIGTGTTASSTCAVAIGSNSGQNASQAVTGGGAMALGGSYASGTDSFAAANADNTGTYGAQGANSVAIGQQAKASGTNAVVLGGAGNLASGNYSHAYGKSSIAAQYGKQAFGAQILAVAGDMQLGTLVLGASTTGTLVILTSDAAAATTTNQLIVASNQVMTFKGTIIGKQTASANIAAYEITGTLVNNAGTVTMPTGTVTAIGTPTAGWTAPTLAADNTNKGLTVNSGFNAATNIRWVCYLQTAELTYA